MIELLKRPEGATVAHIAEATDGSTRIGSAIAARKGAGLTAEATPTRESAPTRPAPRAARPSTGS